MNIKKLLILAPVAVLSLTSCGTSVRYKNEDYQINFIWDTDKQEFYNILHLTDFHISNTSDNPKHFKFIENTVNKAKEQAPGGKIDLIAITGDMFIFAGRSEANELFNFLDKLEIPWAPTFGNHDEQVYFPVDWLTSRLNELNEKRSKGESYCVFKDLQDDDVFGNANYVINLNKPNGDLVEQLYFFDSNRYNFGEYRGYDYIHHDQIDWYERQLSDVNNPNIRSLAFFHIPFPEFEANYQIAKNGTDSNITFRTDVIEQDHDTGTGDPKVNTGLYDVMKKHGSTNGVFVGHNHTSNYAVEEKYEYKPGLAPEFKKIALCFGVKSTNKVYCDPTKLGGQIISIYGKNDASLDKSIGDFTIKRVFNEYEE